MTETGGEPDPPESNVQKFDQWKNISFNLQSQQNRQILFQVMFDYSDPLASGNNVMTNPSNIDTSNRSLMINEDRVDANRSSATLRIMLLRMLKY